MVLRLGDLYRNRLFTSLQMSREQYSTEKYYKLVGAKHLHFIQVKLRNKLSWKCHTRRYNFSYSDNGTDKMFEN